MLVLVSFVLVLAAAVTLVVGLLQSGLALIYLSIGCSVLAGVVLAVAVLRGRPEPRPAAAGRSFTPPQRAEAPVAVGAATTATETTSSWSSPPAAPPPPPPPPPAPPGEDLATRAAGSALLGRLRGRRAEQEADAPTVVAAPSEPTASGPEAMTAASGPEAMTMEMPAAVVMPAEAPDGFPIEDYDRLRATELLSMLPALDRNQLEAVRQRESSGKNRFTVMSRVDSLLASRAEPAWEAEDDEWDEGVGGDAESEAAAIEVEAIREEDGFGDALDELEEEDEVAELVSPSPAAAFPIAGYETLTVGQILPRLSDLGSDELAQIRARELQGRNRGTILDRVDRLSARAGTPSSAMAMPPPAPAPAPRKSTPRKSTPRKAPASKAPAVSKTTAPAVKKTRTPRAAEAAPLPVPAAPTVPAKATRKSPAKKATVAPVAPATKAVRKSPARKAPAAPAPAPSAMKDAVKKARATKKATKRS